MRYYSTNRVGVSTELLADSEFNQYPVDLHIHGTRETNRGLFRTLDTIATDPERAAEVFEDYMAIMFGLDPEQREPDQKGRRRFRSSYRRLLRGWGFDSNSAEGAVMKGWVESRFGLFPTFHKAPLERFPSEAWVKYLEEKASSRFHNNSISLQLDLIYEFCQWWFARFHPDLTHYTLYRGSNDCEQQIIERREKRLVVMRFNNLLSFSSDRGTADEFGDYILEVKVPRAKILYFSGLLPQVLRGEDEYLVIGGDYLVRLATL